MEKGELIGVYGTLRKDERSDLRSHLYSFGVAFVGLDRINGELYHLGAFPGVKNVPDEYDNRLPEVVVEVFFIKDASIIALLDAYEGYNPDDPLHGLYDRKVTETAKCRKVWVYTYNGLVIPEQRIEGGDWCKSRDIPAVQRRLRA